MRRSPRATGRRCAALYARHAPWLVLRLHPTVRRRRSRRRGSAGHLRRGLASAGRWDGQGEVAAWIWGIGVRRLIDRARGRRPPARVRPLSGSRSGSRRPRSRCCSASSTATWPARWTGSRRSCGPWSRPPCWTGSPPARPAPLLGIPAGTVKTRMMRARAAAARGAGMTTRLARRRGDAARGYAARRRRPAPVGVVRRGAPHRLRGAAGQRLAPVVDTRAAGRRSGRDRRRGSDAAAAGLGRAAADRGSASGRHRPAAGRHAGAARRRGSPRWPSRSRSRWPAARAGTTARAVVFLLRRPARCRSPASPPRSRAALDPTYELALAAPYSELRLLLLRTVAVLGSDDRADGAGRAGVLPGQGWTAVAGCCRRSA